MKSVLPRELVVMQVAFATPLMAQGAFAGAQ